MSVSSAIKGDKRFPAACLLVVFPTCDFIVHIFCLFVLGKVSVFSYDENKHLLTAPVPGASPVASLLLPTTLGHCSHFNDE